MDILHAGQRDTFTMIRPKSVRLEADLFEAKCVERTRSRLMPSLVDLGTIGFNLNQLRLLITNTAFHHSLIL